jgi:hypothetical protein
MLTDSQKKSLQKFNSKIIPAPSIVDKTGLVTGYCAVPWNQMIIISNGEIFNCGCPGYLTSSMGNILKLKNTDEFKEIFDNSNVKKDILNLSYRSCRGDVCPILINNINKSKINFDTITTRLNKPVKTIYLDIDKSCNLKCPTCRPDIIMEKENPFGQQLLRKVEEIILPAFADNEVQIRISAGGEFLASNLLRNWFLNFNFEKHSNVKFYLHTNATLLYQIEDYLYSIANNISDFLVSIDACTEETYSQTRLNGKWENLIKGLEIIQNINKINPSMRHTFAFCISSSNYHEVTDFAEFSKKYDARAVQLQTLVRWAQDDVSWQEQNIFNKDHPKHGKFLEILKNFNFDDPYVNHALYEYRPKN